MKIVLWQNSYGNFNFLSNDKTTVCHIKIVDNNNVIYKVNDKKCVLYLKSCDYNSVEENIDAFYNLDLDYFNNNADTMNNIHEYAAFMSLLKNNYSLIINNTKEYIIDKYNLQIESIQNKIENINILDNEIPVLYVEEVERYRKYANESISDFVKWSDTYNAKVKSIKFRLDKYNKLSDVLWYDKIIREDI